MRYKGWVRLWIVLTLIAVPTIAELDFQQKERFWGNLDQITTKVCVDQEFESPNHPDAIECSRKAGSAKTIFERENTTPRAYWTGAFGYAFILDLIATALIIAAFLVARWVWRGFRNSN